MTFELAAGNGHGRGAHWAKWVDEDAAMAHLRVLRSEARRSDNSSLMGDQTYAEQLAFEAGVPGGTPGELTAGQLAAWRADRLARQTARCVSIATALRGFALACDMEIFALAPYAPGRLAGDAGEGDYPGLYANYGAWRVALMEVLQAHNSDVRDAIANGGDMQVDLYLRVDFTASGEVQSLADVIDPDSGSDRREGLTMDPHGWNAWTGWVVKTYTPGFGAASSRVEITALAPLSLTWALLLRCAQSIAMHGLDDTLSLSAAWCAARNASLSRALGGTGLPRTIVEASAAADVQALGNGDIPPQTQALLAAAVAIATAINPIAGIVVGLLVGIAEVLYRVIPVATAYAVDAWKRRQPFLQALDYTGKIATHTPPTHVPPPPAYAVAPDVGDELLGVPQSVPDETPEPEPEPESTGGGGVLGWAAVIALGAKFLLG